MSEYIVTMHGHDYRTAISRRLTRCRDCKHHSESGLCKAWSMFGTVTTDDADFCSRAEPKEVEG